MVIPLQYLRLEPQVPKCGDLVSDPTVPRFVPRIRTEHLQLNSHGLHVQIWVCLKIGYIPNYSHLIGIMIINHWV